jgi:hypothetical protein
MPDDLDSDKDESEISPKNRDECQSKANAGQLLLFPLKKTDAENKVEFAWITRMLVGEIEKISSLGAGALRDCHIQTARSRLEQAKAIIARLRLTRIYTEDAERISSIASNLSDLISAP